MGHNLGSTFTKQVEALFKIIFDLEPSEPKTKMQRFLQSAQALLSNLLTTFIYAAMLSVIVWQVLQPLFQDAEPFDWTKLARNPRSLIFAFLIFGIAFVISLRLLLIITNFMRSFRVYAFIGVLIALKSVLKTLPKLLAADSLSEVGREILEMLQAAGGGG